ncbi:cytidine deaminase [Actinomadura meridiana]|uniref:Cytidine deaminase n=1 Tax=Actinomadura meridiana TaxID=559626 RepID=A0ABP8BXM2_9ACTN
MSELNPEDAKIITLARSARARTNAPEGAAVRDETGRTYAATTVDLPSLKLSALKLAVAMAVASGADSLEAAAVVTQAETTPPTDVETVRDLGPKAPILIATPNGTLQKTLKT